MILDLEALLVTFVFLLPGFLTSRLVEARTPAVSRKPTPFEETLESFLRSVIIHLVIAIVVLVGLWRISPQYDLDLLRSIGAKGFSAYYSARPLEAVTVPVLWLAAAFLLAFAFGVVWDPIDFALKKVATKTGLLSEDILYFLQRTAGDIRKETEDYQLWVQARLKNGYTYRGEFFIGGYHRDDKTRELLLANVKFFPFPAQTFDEDPSPPKFYDYVVIDLSNCISLEVLNTDVPASQ